MRRLRRSFAGTSITDEQLEYPQNTRAGEAERRRRRSVVDTDKVAQRSWDCDSPDQQPSRRDGRSASNIGRIASRHPLGVGTSSDSSVRLGHEPCFSANLENMEARQGSFQGGYRTRIWRSWQLAQVLGSLEPDGARELCGSTPRTSQTSQLSSHEVASPK